jgi:oligopeptidase A
VLSTNYSNNLQDATAAYKLLLTQPGQVAGLPSSHLASLAQQARPRWSVTTTGSA